MLKFLHDIADLVRSRRQKKIELLFDSGTDKKPTKLSKLHQSILGGVESDAMAAKAVYGNAETKDSSRYKMLKKNLTDRLLNSLFFLNLNEARYTDYDRAQYQCTKTVAQLLVLRRYGSLDSERALAKRLEIVAKKYDFTFARVTACVALRKYYKFNGDVAAYMEVEERELELRKILNAEEEASILLDRFGVYFTASIAPQFHRLPEMRAAAAQIAEWYNKYKTFQLHESYINIYDFIAQVERNYDTVIWIANEALTYYEANKQFTRSQRLGHFNLLLLSAYTSKGEYDKAMTHRLKCRSYLTAGSTNWFYFKQNEFLLLIRSEQMEEAGESFREVLMNPRIEEQPKPVREFFTILECYARFYCSNDFTSTFFPVREEQRNKPISIKEFAAIVPTVKNDAGGYYGQIIIARTIYLMADGDRRGILECDEALQKLRRTRLEQGSEYYRLACMVKLIHTIVQGDFVLKRVEKLSAVWLEKLKMVKFVETSGTTSEVVFFDKVWSDMMKFLAVHTVKMHKEHLLERRLANRTKRKRRKPKVKEV